MVDIMKGKDKHKESKGKEKKEHKGKEKKHK